jgi:hypothetical protein
MGEGLKREDFMKKEAPEQTAVLGQTPLSLILDEIEVRAKEARKNAPFEVFAINVAKTAADVPALVKALRRAIKTIKDCRCDRALEDIAAILNQK